MVYIYYVTIPTLSISHILNLVDGWLCISKSKISNFTSTQSITSVVILLLIFLLFDFFFSSTFFHFLISLTISVKTSLKLCQFTIVGSKLFYTLYLYLLCLLFHSFCLHYFYIGFHIIYSLKFSRLNNEK